MRSRPFVALLVSGGHTLLLWVPEWGRYHLMGETRDDAAGEAFDKVARIVGLPYPGGPAIEKAAVAGDPGRYRFPRPLLKKKGGRASGRGGRAAAFDFSFSGLKTAVARTVAEVEGGGGGPGARSGGGPARESRLDLGRPHFAEPETASRLDAERPHLAASFQEAVVDVLSAKTLAATAAVGCDRVLVGGGVAANRALKSRIREGIGPGGRLFAASPRLSMDNGAMIARAGHCIVCRAAISVGSRGSPPARPSRGCFPGTPDPPHHSSPRQHHIQLRGPSRRVSESLPPSRMVPDPGGRAHHLLRGHDAGGVPGRGLRPQDRDGAAGPHRRPGVGPDLLGGDRRHRGGPALLCVPSTTTAWPPIPWG